MKNILLFYYDFKAYTKQFFLRQNEIFFDFRQNWENTESQLFF